MRFLQISSLLFLLPLLAISQDRAVVIASKAFPESRLLAEIMAIQIESNTQYSVKRRHGLGGTLICFEALKNGNIDLYPEYTGTGLTAILNEELRSKDPQTTYDLVKDRFSTQYQITWLAPLGFNNTYALAASTSIQATKISDLHEMAASLNVGVSAEFLNRPDGYPGLSKHYGLIFPNIRGMEHGLTFGGVESGELDLIDVYTTEGLVRDYELRILEDDLHFFPPYWAAPLVKSTSLTEFPDLEAVLQQLAGSIDDELMRDLNYQVEVEGKDYRVVATNFLEQAGLITANSVQQSIWRDPIFKNLWQHIYLCAIAVFMAILIGIPLGIIATKYEVLARLILSMSGIIQTIPSLAILGFMIPLLGIGTTPAIAALFLYALLPIVRNTFTGIKAIDPNLIEAAMAMGMNPNQLITKVELPMALNVIVAGIRTSTVINIGTATLAAFIGAGGLGEFIITGITLNDHQLILKGAIPAALLALLADYLFAILEKRITPRGLRMT